MLPQFSSRLLFTGLAKGVTRNVAEEYPILLVCSRITYTSRLPELELILMVPTTSSFDRNAYGAQQKAK